MKAANFPTNLTQSICRNDICTEEQDLDHEMAKTEIPESALELSIGGTLKSHRGVLMKSSSGTARDLSINPREKFMSCTEIDRVRSHKDKDESHTDKNKSFSVDFMSRSDEANKSFSVKRKDRKIRPRKCCAKFTEAPSKMVEGLENIFYRLGFWIAWHPYAVIWGSLIAVGMASTGWST